MGWGYEPHEGYADEKWPDGHWTGGSGRSATDPDPLAYRASCSCGWRSEHEHPVPPRPESRDEATRETWFLQREGVYDRCQQDWNAEHFEGMLGYEPHQQLILGKSPGGPRHFLDGRPVNAGSALELLLEHENRWLPIRYEWSWQNDQPPTAHIALGVPPGAEGLTHLTVSFPLPPRAILRWPTRTP
ncbi:MAG: hypothetical protein H0X28_02755 [Solirubrobacterales bacterium]|nr:hypothetical protein [Solirubrobacterales bacterium]